MPPALTRLEQRTQLLLSAGPYLPGAHAAIITGRTQQALGELARQGDIETRRIRANAIAYNTRAALSLAKGPVDLFSELRETSAVAPRITDTELDEELAQVTAGPWWTVHRRDYAPPDWPTWAAWWQGNTTAAEADIEAEMPRWQVRNETYLQVGVIRRTLWIAPEKLGDFGRYSRCYYQKVTEAGGHVRVLPARRFTYVEERGLVPDLEVTPHAVYVRHHTRLGSRDGASRITDPTLVEITHQVLEWARREHSISLSLKEFSPEGVTA